jgi:hypothetical protein
MHQGDTWSWLSAATSIFGSASSLWVLPIPGLNYGVSLAGRTTSMQDRSIMLPGLQELTSGGKTSSYMRMREGMSYLCHYATTNPAETPTQFEFLAYALLGPVFKDKLTVEHIEKFTEAVHAIRDPFWKEGGIPKADRKDALKAMRSAFTGAGLEVTLINLGLNPGNIDFNSLNGAIGKIGNVGAGKAVHAEQVAYGKALSERLAHYVEEGLISEERAAWVKEGIELRSHGKDQPATTPAIATTAKPIPAATEELPQQEAPKFATDKLKQPNRTIAATGNFTDRVSNTAGASYEPML